MSEKDQKTDNLSPQQQLFASYYLDPKSETFSNALQSALKAGYSKESAENITGYMPKWLSELLGKKQRLVRKAEKRLEQAIEDKDIKVGLDATKFTLSRLNKEEYSERTELTGAEGKEIKIIIEKELAEQNGLNTSTSDNS